MPFFKIFLYLLYNNIIYNDLELYLFFLKITRYVSNTPSTLNSMVFPNETISEWKDSV